ncbi:MAG: DUF6062 family protein [bacterium]|nr:DUF6062 family protein [bacterium]
MTTFGFHDLIEACAEPGCPVCRLLRRDVRRQIDTLLYEFVLDQGAQRRFRAGRGLCGAHGELLAEGRNALGTAALQFAVISDVLDALDSAVRERVPLHSARFFKGSGGDALATALDADLPCMVCAQRDQDERRYAEIIAGGLGDARLLAAYRESDGLCLPHFRAVLQAVRGLSSHSGDARSQAERVRAVVAIQRAIWERLKDELAEFMRKSDFHNAAETMGAEADSWRRAIALLSGRPI